MLYDLSLHIGYRYEVPASGAHHMLRLLPLSLPDRQRLVAGAITVSPITAGLEARSTRAGSAIADAVLRLGAGQLRVVDTDLFGINGSWRVNDSLTMTGDVYRSTSERKSGGQDTYVVLRMNQPNVTRIDLARDAVLRIE